MCILLRSAVPTCLKHKYTTLITQIPLDEKDETLNWIRKLYFLFSNFPFFNDAKPEIRSIQRLLFLSFSKLSGKFFFSCTDGAFVFVFESNPLAWNYSSFSHVERDISPGSKVSGCHFGDTFPMMTLATAGFKPLWKLIPRRCHQDNLTHHSLLPRGAPLITQTTRFAVYNLETKSWTVPALVGNRQLNLQMISSAGRHHSARGSFYQFWHKNSFFVKVQGCEFLMFHTQYQINSKDIKIIKFEQSEGKAWGRVQI